MLAPVLVTPPTEEPVSLTEAKAHCRLDHDEDDVILAAFIAAAVGHLDGRSGVLGRCMVEQTWRASFGAWPSDGRLRLPFPDVSSLAVFYSDENDAQQTLGASLYELQHDHRGAYVRMRNGFNSPALYDDREDAVRVEFTTGFGAAEDVPATLKAAILLTVSHLYENREAVVVGTGLNVHALPLGVDTLIAPYRRVGV